MERPDRIEFSPRWGKVNFQLNFPPTAENPNPDEFLYLNIRMDHRSDDSYAALSREDTVTLRDHLTMLLGEKENPEKDAPEVDRATVAMEDLAYQLSLLDMNSLDALTSALNSFNK